MEELVLKAMVRSESPQKVRRAGFIPGVLHEHDTTSTSVQFETAALNKIIAKHGANAKIWVEFGPEKKFGFIKEIQTHPVEGKIIHVTIQLVSKDQDVKMQLPISFHGRDALEQKLLQVQVYKPSIDGVGKTALMPDVVVVDVAKKELGGTITLIDFSLPKGIKILDPENEIYGVVKAIKGTPAEEPEAVIPAE
jgi:large subunit ribosomal protein L25